MNSVTQIRQNVMFALKYNCLPYDVIISDVNRYLSTSLRAFVALWRFPTQEDLRRVRERFAGGLALILSVKALQTSRQLVLLKLGLLLSSRRRNACANDEAYPQTIFDSIILIFFNVKPLFSAVIGWFLTSSPFIELPQWSVTRHKFLRAGCSVN